MVVSLEEAKLYLRVDSDEEDTLICQHFFGHIFTEQFI